MECQGGGFGCRPFLLRGRFAAVNFDHSKFALGLPKSGEGG